MVCALLLGMKGRATGTRSLQHKGEYVRETKLMTQIRLLVTELRANALKLRAQREHQLGAEVGHALDDVRSRYGK